MLLAAGADMGARSTYSQDTALTMAASNGHADIVEALLVAGAHKDARGNYGNTALTNASDQGHTNIVKMLLVAGADVNAKDNDGFTLLMKAGRQGDIDIVKMLLAAGADVNAKDEHGHTALWLAEELRYKVSAADKAACIAALKAAGAKK